MTTTTRTAGFYGTDSDTFYVTPSGRVWLVGSEDELPTVREMDGLPAEATSLDGMITPEEAINWIKQVESESGEELLSTGTPTGF